MRRKILRTFTAVVLILSMLTVPAFADGAIVTGKGVNVRSGPGSSYRVVDCLDYGTAVTVTDQSNGSWYAITYDGGSGFMSAKYLSLTGGDAYADSVVVVVGEDGSSNSGSGSSSNSDSGSSSSGSNSNSNSNSGSSGNSNSDSSGQAGYINANYVRFRTGPSTSYSVLGEYLKGKQVTVTGTSGNWTACIIDGRSGYISSKYITLGAPPAAGSEGPVAVDPDKDPSDSGSGSDVVVATDPPVPESPAPAPAEPSPSPAPSAEPEDPGTTPVDSRPGHINGNYVRFRTGPSTSHSIIGTYNRGKTLTITGTAGDWTACTIDGASGYVFTQYVLEDGDTGGSDGNNTDGNSGDNSSAGTGAEGEGGGSTVVAPEVSTSSEPGYITGNSVRLRSGPSTSADVITELYYGNSVTITGTSGEWTAITYNGKNGYVYSQYVAKGEYKPVSSGGSSDLGREIADYALQYVGYKYTWGGSSPSTGFDCSGLMYYVYKHFGYTLNRVANDQTRNGKHVDPSDLQPGDILCFYSGSNYVGHVGMYIGDNKFVHAANSNTGVIITEIAGNYASRGFEARRII